MDNIVTKPSPASPQELSSLLTESGNNEKKIFKLPDCTLDLKSTSTQMKEEWNRKFFGNF